MTSSSAQYYDNLENKKPQLANIFMIFNNGEVSNAKDLFLRFIVKYQEALKKGDMGNVIMAQMTRFQAFALMALQGQNAAPIVEKKSWLQNAFDTVSNTVDNVTETVANVFTPRYTPNGP